MTTDHDVALRAARLIGNACSEAKWDGRNPNWKPAYQVQLRGKRAVLLMQELYPHMGERRQAQIRKALQSQAV